MRYFVPMIMIMTNDMYMNIECVG